MVCCTPAYVLSVTHIMLVLSVVGVGMQQCMNPKPKWNAQAQQSRMDANMQLTINSFRLFFPEKIFSLTFPWHFQTFSKIPDISLTAVKFPDVSRFLRQVVTLHGGMWPQLLWCSKKPHFTVGKSPNEWAFNSLPQLTQPGNGVAYSIQALGLGPHRPATGLSVPVTSSRPTLSDTITHIQMSPIWLISKMTYCTMFQVGC